MGIRSHLTLASGCGGGEPSSEPVTSEPFGLSARVKRRTEEAMLRRTPPPSMARRAQMCSAPQETRVESACLGCTRR